MSIKNEIDSGSEKEAIAMVVKINSKVLKVISFMFLTLNLMTFKVIFSRHLQILHQFQLSAIGNSYYLI